MECDIELLISEVQQRPAIWDKSLEIYKDRIATTNAWREVFNTFNADFETMSSSEKKKYGKQNLIILKILVNLKIFAKNC